MTDAEFLDDRDCEPKGRTMSLREAAEAVVESWDRDPQGSWPELDALREALAEPPGDDAEHFHRVVSQLGKAACRVDDLVTLCKRLCRALKHIAPTHTLLAQVDAYLRREGLTGLPLREALAEAPKAEAEKAEPVAWMHNQRVDCIHNEVKELLQRAGGHLLRPLDKTENYTIPLYAHPPAALPESAELSDEECDDVILGLGLSYLSRASEMNRSVLHRLCRDAVAAAKGKP